MTDDRDLTLQNLFNEAEYELESEAFVGWVMIRTRSRRKRLMAGGVATALLLAVCVWLLALPVQQFVYLTAQFLTTTLINLGDSWVAWVFAPVNNIASLTVLSFKAIRVGWKKKISSSYASL